MKTTALSVQYITQTPCLAGNLKLANGLVCSGIMFISSEVKILKLISYLLAHIDTHMLARIHTHTDMTP
jgi:hypothetical protein